MHILRNISQSKGNQAMKFGQVIEYNRNIFLQKSSKHETGRLVDLFVFEKALYEVKASGLQLSFSMF